MASMEVDQTTSRPIELPSSSPRISFSADLLDESGFITITPISTHANSLQDKKKIEVDPFEFLSSNNIVSSNNNPMLSPDELFFEGKLLPFWHTHHAEKLNNLQIKTNNDDICVDICVEEEEKEEVVVIINKEETTTRGSWFVDDDPSPRPPNCTVLWKELLRLKKQRTSSTLSPSSSSSSSSSNSFADVADREKEAMGSKEKYMKRLKRGLERTRSASIRIRPTVNVPICTQMKNSALPPLFPLRKGRLDR